MVERVRRETEGGILHWGREDGPDTEWFREKIRRAYGGRAPTVLDPFAGGGAIPLESMRLGCEATATDINPVAWFILKCTLDYPQRLSGRTVLLPSFVHADRDFIEIFLKAKGIKGKTLSKTLAALGLDKSSDRSSKEGPVLVKVAPWHKDSLLDGDLAWHVRAWGLRVMAKVRARLAERYPTYAEFQALASGGTPHGARPLALLKPDGMGNTSVGPLNKGYHKQYLDDRRNPRWVAKPTVAYLWARTVRCKSCRATLPLLKTRWLCKKHNKRVLLTMTPKVDATGVVFGVQLGVPLSGRDAAQRRESDERIGAGTMSRSGARCPNCAAIMTMEDIRFEGRAGRLGATMTAVVVDGPNGKEYRVPEEAETGAADVSPDGLDALYADIPFGIPTELTPRQGPGASRAFSVENYGLDRWDRLFTNRQLLALGTIIRELRGCSEEMDGVPDEWREAIMACLAPSIGRVADRGSVLATWTNDPEKIRSTFARFALPVVWDFAESCPIADTTGGFIQAVEWIARVVEHLQRAAKGAPDTTVLRRSATAPVCGGFDVICTDPPYYDAIPYSDLMDFFYVWLRRTLNGVLPDADTVFADPLGPKWDAADCDGELIDDASRFGGDKALSMQTYENGMARAFQACHEALNPAGRLVVVFANKSPDAWETLVAALIRAGFMVTGSWPIQTEMQNRQRSLASAALASSVWLVCRKRGPTAPGWDTSVLSEMRDNIIRKLRDYWDAGIRGPDFVWAATGPALEAFSKYPVVKKADEPGAIMAVSEFLREVRRMVVDFVVGRVLTRNGGSDAASDLDDITTYYLLHRGDFGLGDAPAGACILYALSCNLSDRELSDRLNILSRQGSAPRDESEDDEDTSGPGGAGTHGSRGTAKLLPWSRRKAKWLGVQCPGGHPVPLIDRAHKLMHLWRAGEEAGVNAFIDEYGLASHALFTRLLQALIELAQAGSEERAILESVSNHIAARSAIDAPQQTSLEL